MADHPPADNLVALAHEAADVLTRVSIPLYLRDNDRPWLCGTGFIVKADAAHYLVSAAHVLDDAKEKGLFFYSEPSRPRFVAGPLRRSSNRDNRATDPFDIVVVKLADGEMPPYRAVDKHAVPLSWLRPGRVPRAGRTYLIIGFPQSQARVSSATQEVNVVSYAYHAASVDESRYDLLGLSAGTHVAIHLDLEVGFDPEGKHRNFPKPKGISGAPMFELWGHDEDDPSIFPVVAVGIEYRKNERAMVGTDVAVVLDMIQTFDSDSPSHPTADASGV